MMYVMVFFVSCFDFSFGTVLISFTHRLYEPRSEKTGLRGFRPGPIQTKLYSHRRWIEA